jgi:hypothetical protein
MTFTLSITPLLATQSISTSFHYNTFTVNKSSWSSQFFNCSELHYTALINATNRRLISLFCSTHKVFKSHANSSQADFSTLTACLLLLTPPACDWLKNHLGFPYWLGTDHAENSLNCCVRLGGKLACVAQQPAKHGPTENTAFIVTSRTTSSPPRQSIGPLAAAQQRDINTRLTVGRAYRGKYMVCMAMLMYCWHALKLGVHRAVAQPCVYQILHNINWIK